MRKSYNFEHSYQTQEDRNIKWVTGIAERINMMQNWADLVDGLAETNKPAARAKKDTAKKGR